MRRGIKRSKWLRVGLILVALVIGCGVVLAVDIYAYSFVTDPSPADAAIVLGAAVWGNEPSPVFEERIKHAINLYRAGHIKAIIFTGGIGEGERVAESIVASRYAMARSVAAEDIFCETLSKFTHDNLRGAKAIIEQQHWGRVLIVSDPLHMRRAITMARDLGIDAYPSPTPTSRYVSLPSQIDFLWGEVRFYATYLVRRASLSAAPDYSAVQPCKLLF